MKDVITIQMGKQEEVHKCLDCEYRREDSPNILLLTKEHVQQTGHTVSIQIVLVKYIEKRRPGIHEVQGRSDLLRNDNP